MHQKIGSSERELVEVLDDMAEELIDFGDMIVQAITKNDGKKLRLSDIVFGKLTAKKVIKQINKIFPEFQGHLQTFETLKRAAKGRSGEMQKQERAEQLKHFRSVVEDIQTTLNYFC